MSTSAKVVVIHSASIGLGACLNVLVGQLRKPIIYKEAKRIADLLATSREWRIPRWTVRPIAYLVILFTAAVVVAVLTPSVDAISMAIPWLFTSAVLCGLFEIGWFIYRRNKD